MDIPSLSNNSTVTFGIIIGCLLMGLYIFICWKKKTKNLELGDAVVILLSGAGISAGFRICFLSFNDAICQANSIERTYIFIGGLSVVWVSIQSIFKILKEI